MSARRPGRGGSRGKQEPPADPVATTPPAEAPARPAVPALEIDDQLAALFVAEALDHLGSIESSVLTLERRPDDAQALDEVFRPFHTIKANAGALGLADVEELAHAIEDLLGRARSGEHHVGTPEVEVILQSVDLLTAMVSDFEARRAGAAGIDFSGRCAALRRMVAGLTAPAAHEESLPQLEQRGLAAPLPADPHARATIKVETRKLDNLIDLMGELVILQSMIGDDPRAVGQRDERVARSLAQLHRISGDLHRAAIALRLVPVRQTFHRMRRLVRDLSRKSGKDIELEIVGEETELDRKVVEEIADPLMHMLRNSIDHGIEDAPTRLAAGKPAAGRIVLAALHEGGSVIISVSDDGRGIETARLRERAVARGLIAPDAKLSDSETHALVFAPGLSTAAEVTEMSGRGVGMDVVGRNVEALRGRIDIRSVPGQGTTFTIKMPLTLATIEGLVVGVGDERFVLPTFSVRELLRCSDDNLHDLPGHGRLVQVRDALLPIVRLADLFAIAGGVDEPTGAALVVIEDHGRRVALMVDRLLGKQDVVIKPLGEAFTNVAGVAGGAILADGRVGLIVDSTGLIHMRDRDLPTRAA